MNIRILSGQLRAFELLSHDRNPLHTDPAYARLTQFGRPIVYGMCGVLLGLGSWANGRPFRLVHLQGRFTKPLFESVAYELQIVEGDRQVKIQYLEAGSVLLSFCFSWEETALVLSPSSDPRPDVCPFQPLAVAKSPQLPAVLPQWQERDCAYSICLERLTQLLPQLGLEPTQLPLDQLNALMGSSYLVGMEMPGRQALYSGFEFEFASPTTQVDLPNFQFRAVSAALDVRFNRLSLSGHGPGIRSFSVSAFRRPDQVRYGLADIRKVFPPSESLKGKIAFVTGASRGFGSVLANMLALQKAHVFVNYRFGRDEAEALALAIRPWNPNVFPIAGDVGRLEDCQRIRAEIGSRFGRIDILVSNAFPQIPVQGFLEQGGGDFLKFLEIAVSTTVTLFRELLPLVSNRGIVMLISTCYTRQPATQFSHYVAAKSCLEGLMRSLAVEFPDLKFLIVRPPRMLTDQTNLAFDLSPPASAIAVARDLMAALPLLGEGSNLAELDLGRN